MDKIIIETQLKEMPSTCAKCKYSGFRVIEDNVINLRYCRIKDKNLEKTYNKKKNNWSYLRPKWCPLIIKN